MPIVATLTAMPLAPAAAARPTEAASAGIAGSPVKHVIEVMIENHTFDNLFGRFPGADGIPANASFPNPGGDYGAQCVAGLGDAQRGRRAGGNRQLQVRRTDGHGLPARQGLPDGPLHHGPAGRDVCHYRVRPVVRPRRAVPRLGLRARRPQLPAGHRTDPAERDDRAQRHRPRLVLQPAPWPAQQWNSIFDELTAHGRTWKIYYALPTSVLSGTIWDQIIPSGHTADLTSAGQFFTDLVGGRLPDFSFVRPGVGYSSEPPEDIEEADAWIGQLVTAVARSRYWNSTAIFVTYDEGGGFWDHVAPSYASGYGTRTPTIIVSPYARHGVFHQQITNVSILSFMQALWGLPPLTMLNARQHNLLSAFDFRQAPLPSPTLPSRRRSRSGFTAPAASSPTSDATRLAQVAHHQPGGGDRRAFHRTRRSSRPCELTLTSPPACPYRRRSRLRPRWSTGRRTLPSSSPADGYYRIKASGPDGSVGWVTVDVGVNPGTAP